MNFKSVLQAFSSALQSNTTTTPPIPTTPTQNGTSLPIPEAILIELDLLDQDQDQDLVYNYATSRQSISTAPLPIPTTPTQNRTSPPIPQAILIDLSQDQDQDQDHSITYQSNSTTPPPIPTTQVQQNSMPLPPEAQYPSKEALFKAIQAWAKPHGYAFTIGRSKKREGSGRIKVFYTCDRHNIVPTRERICNTISRGTGCPFSVIACELPNHEGQELKHRSEYKFSTYNHAPSPYPSAHPSYRHIPS